MHVQTENLGQAGLGRPERSSCRLQVGSCTQTYWGIINLQLADGAGTVLIGIQRFCQAEPPKARALDGSEANGDTGGQRVLCTCAMAAAQRQ